VLRALVEHFADRPQTLPGAQPMVPAGSEAAVRAAVTYVGGMTDRFAFHTAVGLLGWDPARLPAGVDTPVPRR
jgi:dGTPase